MNNANHIIHRAAVSGQSPTISLEKARNGMWTGFTETAGVPFYLHSRYDPVNEAERFIAAQLKDWADDRPERIVIYGMGCGHHVKALLKETHGSDVIVEVWESNVPAFSLMESKGVFEGLLEEPRLMAVVTEELLLFSERIQEWQGQRVLVIVHEPSLRIVPPELEPLKRVLRDYQMQKNSAIVHRDLLQANFDRNVRTMHPSLSLFQDMHAVPAILISAGPSLVKSLASLADASKYALLGAVGTVVSLLLSHGIRPDFVVMSDPQPNMLDQLQGWETEEDIPLFYLSTLYSEVVERYRGPQFILYQEGFDSAEEMASARGEPLVKTGGSVSTTLFSLSKLLRFEPICLVGQDLAYTDNSTHAAGTPLYQKFEEHTKGEYVKAVDGRGMVRSPRNLQIYKKWFEERALESNETYYNGTEGGAYIEGFSHVSLAEFVALTGKNDVAEAREYFQRQARSSFTT
ncbi:motility associated factor glycosyltransferase family protein [Cohnella faecalis]|uniref:DUF115 domain-containing protein n=1 Tax=Cohnella faecalis TaxID=2315694 RepID=A0A398CQH5_9BACL|nr:6-hydroxymethylpterin diphosphokinase MptE-like protein [Cohnella faecalis]RIE02067.1 DUF115 domain-containing protein [Cohnella faecalis]